MGTRIDGCCAATLTCLDEDVCRKLDRSATDGVIWLPLCITGEIEVPGLLHVALLDGPVPPGTRPRHITLAMANAIGAALPQHPVVAREDAGGRHAAAAKDRLERSLPPHLGPLAAYSGASYSSWEMGISELLVGGYALSWPEAQEVFESAYHHNMSVPCPETTTWPAGLLADAVDVEHTERVAAEKRSDDARARIAAQMSVVQEVTLAEIGQGLVVQRGARLPESLYAHHDGIPQQPLVSPTLKIGARDFYLWAVPPGMTLDQAAGIDEIVPGVRMADPAMVVRLPGGALNVGCPDPVFFFIEATRADRGLVDHRAIAESEFCSAGREEDALADLAKEMATPHLARVWFRYFGPSLLVRGLLLHPSRAAELLREMTAPPAAPPDTDVSGTTTLPNGSSFTRGSWEHYPTTGDANDVPFGSEPAQHIDLDVLARKALFPTRPPAPVVEAPEPWQQECLDAATGVPAACLHSPGQLTRDVRPSLLKRLATAIADPYAPILKSALRERTEPVRSTELVQILTEAGQEARIDDKTSTSRIKKVVEKLGWTKKVVQIDGVATKAYSRNEA